MSRYLFPLLVSLAYMPVSIAVAADRNAALPPPTKVQNTPEAKETVQPPGNGNALGKQFLTPDGKHAQVRILKHKDGATVEEYFRHGRMYKIKVSPAAGTPPYYLYDRNGDGSFERQMPGGYKYESPPEWVIKRF